jgi:hypothetical protein
MYSRQTKTDTAGYVKAAQVATVSGSLATLRAHNNGSSTVYLQFHDLATTASEGAVSAAAPIPLPSGTYFESDTPFHFRSGLYICASTTAATKTLIPGNDVRITAEYRY